MSRGSVAQGRRGFVGTGSIAYGTQSSPHHRQFFAQGQNLATLALEELVTNCIKYGYDDQAEHLIEVTMSITESELVMVFTDDGHSFNPLELPEPDTSLPIEDRAVGGLGIHMLRKMSDRMEYVDSGGENRITLRKSFGAQI